MITGIICEYNPFHNGHKLQIDYARKTLGSDKIVVALSPDFTQRGEIALLSKYERTKIALELGVDLIVQIPINAATDSALGYAYGGIKVLDSLGIVDTLLFSCEDNDIDILTKIAYCELNETNSYTKTLTSSLKKGQNYPTSRENAVLSCFMDSDSERIRDILSKPNNILAIEYIKAIKLLNSNITPVCMKRVGASYKDNNIEGNIASASAIRNAIQSGNIDTIKDTVPNQAYNSYKRFYNDNAFLYPDDVSPMLGYKLLQGNLTEYKDCNEELSNRINNELHSFTNLTSFRSLIKSKNTTETRISRALSHVLLDITNDLYEDIDGRILPCIPYIYILGFNDIGSMLMSDIKERCTLPYFTSYNDALEYSFKESSYDNSSVLKLISTDIGATRIYNMILAGKTNKEVTSELSRKFLVV